METTTTFIVTLIVTSMLSIAVHLAQPTNVEPGTFAYHPQLTAGL